MGRRQILGTLRTLQQLIVVILLIVPTLAQKTSTKYVLVAADTHYILSGDIEVRYKIPMTPNALQVQLMQPTPGKKFPLSKVDIPQNTTSGIVIFPCGLLLQAGKAFFRLVTIEKNEILAESQTIRVLWPTITVHVPLLVETYSSDVTVQLHLSYPRCKVLRAKNYTVYVDLIYEGTSLSQNGKGTSIWHEPSVILSKEINEWLLQTAYDVTLNCEYFDRAGYYKVRIRTNLKTASLIAESDTIHVIWSNRYSVSVTKPSVEPCNNNLKIIYHYPRCASDRDRLRVYGKMWQGVSVLPKYIYESRVHTGKYFTKLSCDLFEEDLQEYCFSFVSTAKNGAVFELDTQCIPRKADSGEIHPIWLKWSAWSECSSTCGVGVHSRYRLCSQSDTNMGCDGKSVQTEMCSKQECEDVTTVPSENFTELSLECSCGCTINVTGRLMLKSDDLTPCNLPLYWVLQTSSAGHLLADIKELFFPAPKVMLIAREGASTLGSVLGLFSHLNGSELFYSTTNVLRIEISSPNITFLEGASVKIIITPSEMPREGLAMTQTVSEATRYTLSAVHVIMLLLTIVLCTSAFCLVAILYFFSGKRRKLQSSIPSLCSMVQNLRENSHSQKLLGTSTSTSELSDSSQLHRRSPKKQAPSPSYSPEDYLHNSFLFKSLGSICGTNSSAPSPVPKRTAFKPNVEIPKSPTLSNLSNGTEGKSTPDIRKPLKPLKSALKKHKPTTNMKTSLSCSDTSSPVRRRGKPTDRATQQIRRESTAPLTASVSELSVTGSDDGFEYDYYDYGCHEVPGSFFCTDPFLVGWPPFIPQPPEDLDEECDFPLQHFTPSPTQPELDVKSETPASNEQGTS